MNERKTGYLAILLIVATSFWVGLTIYLQVNQPVAQTLAEKTRQIVGGFRLFILNYINASIITLGCTALFAGFYVLCRKANPLWSVVALIFVPIYGAANLFAYLSQVFIVPRLIALSLAPATESLALFTLAQVIHEWPGSAVQFINGMAYAVLGIPSIIYGMIFWHKPNGPKFGSAMLVFSGVVSFLALAGIGLQSPGLMSLTLVSGFLFLVALIGLSAYFLRSHQLD